MRISEATILQDAFEAAFPFMLNRMADAGYDVEGMRKDEYLVERCWGEFLIALEEIGVRLEDIDVGE